jgi:hypothetical protein
VKKLLLTLALALGGCAAPVVPVQNVAIHYKYIVNTIPPELLAVPPVPAPLNLDTATDKDLVDWLTDSEERSQTMETQLKTIKTYQADKITNLKVPAEDVITN